MFLSRKKILQGVSQVETITLIIVCILLYTQPSNLVYFSNTILGKLLLITSLVLASFHSTFSGFCIALLIVVFSYQTYEGLESGTGMKKPSTESGGALGKADTSNADTSNALTSGSVASGAETIKAANAVVNPIEAEKKDTHLDKVVDTGMITNNKFKKMYCKDNKLRNKNGEIVEQKNMSSVFKTLSFNKGECNPCDETCSFTITDTEERMNTEENLRPADSNSLPIVK